MIWLAAGIGVCVCVCFYIYLYRAYLVGSELHESVVWCLSWILISFLPLLLQILLLHPLFCRYSHYDVAFSLSTPTSFPDCSVPSLFPCNPTIVNYGFSHFGETERRLERDWVGERKSFTGWDKIPAKTFPCRVGFCDGERSGYILQRSPSPSHCQSHKGIFLPWSSLWEPCGVPEGKVRENVGAFLQLQPPGVFTLILVHTQSPADHQLLFQHSYQYGSRSLCSR